MKITKAQLEKLYTDEQLSLAQAGKLLGCSRTTIRNYMKKFEIPCRPPGGHRNRPRISMHICEACDISYKPHTFERAEKSRACSKKCFGILRQADPELRQASINNLPDSVAGKNNPNWNGGTSREPYPFAFGEKLKAQIRNRDKYTCQLCETTQDEQELTLNIHHINYRKDDLRFENLITLCRSCNAKVNGNRPYWQALFETKIKQIYS